MLGSNAILQHFQRDDIDACQSWNSSKVFPKAPGIHRIPAVYIQLEKLWDSSESFKKSLCCQNFWKIEKNEIHGRVPRQKALGRKTNTCMKFAKKHPGDPYEWKLFGKHTFSRRLNKIPAVYVRKTNVAFILRCSVTQRICIVFLFVVAALSAHLDSSGWLWLGFSVHKANQKVCKWPYQSQTFWNGSGCLISSVIFVQCCQDWCFSYRQLEKLEHLQSVGRLVENCYIPLR